jgi:glutamate racemase
VKHPESSTLTPPQQTIPQPHTPISADPIYSTMLPTAAIQAPAIHAAPLTTPHASAAPITTPLDTTTGAPLTLGVFDSGFGGLTVLRQLLPLLPGTRSLYLGDTARLPYGSKSRETISRYALSSAHFLVEQGADLLVVACNTATALALDDLQRDLPIPVLGVIQPGAAAALAHRPDASVLVLATPATVQSHAYLHAIQRLGLRAYEMPCPLLVPLVEEGWTDHPVTDEVLRIYLDQALTAAPDTNTLLLGCTHYPLLEPALRRALDKLGHPLHLIDSAQATAQATAALVAEHFPTRITATTTNASTTATTNAAATTTTTAGAASTNASTNASTSACPPAPNSGSACPTFYATDSVEKFQRLGSHFLGRPLAQVHLLDLGG